MALEGAEQIGPWNSRHRNGRGGCIDDDLDGFAVAIHALRQAVNFSVQALDVGVECRNFAAGDCDGKPDRPGNRVVVAAGESFPEQGLAAGRANSARRRTYRGILPEHARRLDVPAALSH
ncbi:MAG: hypothetical protein ACRETY_06605 [Steroidobacteraceae bacterium]